MSAKPSAGSCHSPTGLWNFRGFSLDDSGFSPLTPDMFYWLGLLNFGLWLCTNSALGPLKAAKVVSWPRSLSLSLHPAALGDPVGSLGAGACPTPGIIILKPLSSPCHKTQLLRSFKICRRFFQLLKDSPFPLCFSCLFSPQCSHLHLSLYSLQFPQTCPSPMPLPCFLLSPSFPFALVYLCCRGTAAAPR